MKKIFSAILLMAAMAFSVSTFVSCNDLIEDVEKVTDQAGTNAEAIKTLQGQVATLESGLASANAAIDAAKKAADAAAEAAATAKKEALEALKAEAEALLAKIEANAADIEDVEAEVADLAEKVKGVEGQVETNTAAIEAIKVQIAALEAFKKNAEAKHAEVEAAIKALQALKTDIEANKTDIAAVKKELEKLTDDVKAIDAKLVTLTKSLRSLVFVPELYVDGVEGDKYEYAEGEYKMESKLENKAYISDDKGVLTEFAKGTIIDWPVATDKAKGYLLPSVQDMYYHLNPSNADVTAAEWGFLAATPDFVETKATRPAVITPSVVGTPAAEDGVLKVLYKVSTPQDLYNKADDKKLSVAALQATFEDYAVTSDYATIIPETQTFQALAYTAASGYKSNETCNTELYKTLAGAITNPYTVNLVYNAGPTNLAELINIHYTAVFNETAVESGKHLTMTLKEAADLYGFNLVFQEIPYKSGMHQTEEDKYLDLTAEGMATPQYVDASGNSQNIAKGDETVPGRSAIGRRPLVLAKLMNGDRVVLAGYIKLEIAEFYRRDNLIIDKTQPKVPYFCQTSVRISWDEMSGQILEYLGMNKKEFDAHYELDQQYTYIFNESTKLFENVYDFKIKGAPVNNNIFGIFTEPFEFEGTTVNDVLQYTLTKSNLDNIRTYFGDTFTLYARYNSKDVQPADVYVGIKINIAENPVIVGIINKVKEAWYPATAELAARDTVRTNVPAPVSGGDVKVYRKNIDDYFYHMVPKNPVPQKGLTFEYSMDPDAYKAGFIEYYVYSFSTKNNDVKIGGKNLHVHVDPTTKAVDGNNLYWDVDAKVGYQPTDLIASIDKDTRTIVYADTDKAKKFLNLYAHNDLTANHQQFAIIEVNAWYGNDGTCKIPLEFKVDNSFKARFLRPLDILPNKAAELIDAHANGASVSLGKFFTVQDWRDMDVMVYDTLAKNPEVVMGAKDVIDNRVNLREYYKIEKVKVDVKSAESNITGSRLPINPEVIKLSLVNNGATLNTDEVDIANNLDDLNATELNYKNNGGNVQDFTIWVPVTVYYAWGEIKVPVPVAVKHTMAN